jgi:hypothetical protein
MAFKIVLFTAIFCLTIPVSPYAQSSGSYMELRFVQRLTWVGDEYALRYEIIIEKEEGGNYLNVLREFTSGFFIEVSLSPGKYRYHVIPHDFLDQPVPVTEWMDFEIRHGVTQDESDRLIPGEHEIIMVQPGNPESRREIKLPIHERAIPETAIPDEPESKQKIITIIETNTVIEYQNQFDLYLGFAWIPLLPLYGENDFFGENLSLYGADMRLGIVSAKRNFLNFGVEGAFSWRVFQKSSKNEPVHSLTLDCNILTQSRFPGGRTALNTRLGAGVSMLPDTYPVSAIGQYSIHTNLGVSFLWLPLKHLYLEAAAEYSQFFTADYFGFIRPSVGVGYRF